MPRPAYPQSRARLKRRASTPQTTARHRAQTRVKLFKNGIVSQTVDFQTQRCLVCFPKTCQGNKGDKKEKGKQKKEMKNIPIQTLPIGLFWGPTLRGNTGCSGIPIFFSCAFAKRIFAWRCCGVCACFCKVGLAGGEWTGWERRGREENEGVAAYHDGVVVLRFWVV